jgi:hypothetical protein
MSKEHFFDVIRGPAITEKGTLVSDKNQVVFNVAIGDTSRRSRRRSKAVRRQGELPSTRWSAKARSSASRAGHLARATPRRHMSRSPRARGSM